MAAVSVAVSVWEVPATSGPAVTGASRSVAPAYEDFTVVVKDEFTGPYGLWRASVQVSVAVSARALGCEAGIAYEAEPVEVAPGARVDPKPATAGFDPSGRASAPRGRWLEHHRRSQRSTPYWAVVPASALAGPVLVRLTTGRCSVEVTVRMPVATVLAGVAGGWVGSWCPECRSPLTSPPP